VNVNGSLTLLRVNITRDPLPLFVRAVVVVLTEQLKRLPLFGRQASIDVMAEVKLHAVFRVDRQRPKCEERRARVLAAMVAARMPSSVRTPNSSELLRWQQCTCRQPASPWRFLKTTRSSPSARTRNGTLRSSRSYATGCQKAAVEIAAGRPTFDGRQVSIRLRADVPVKPLIGSTFGAALVNDRHLSSRIRFAVPS
jgi:hypothetical protein